MAAKKRNKKIKPSLFEKFPNIPTRERINHGGISIRSNIGLVDDPLRIDKLLKNGIIDEMQHLYAMQIITYWRISNRPFIRTSSYEPRIGRLMPDFDYFNVSRMGAEDKFYKTMSYLNERDRGLISKICFEELPAIEAGRTLGLPVNSITSYLRFAFDALGDALAKMRDFRKELENDEN